MSNEFEKVKKVIIEFEDGSVAQSSLFGKDAYIYNALQEECNMYKNWLKWQPIETAPKDGTEIIGLYYNGGIECVRLMWYMSAEEAVSVGECRDDEGWWSIRSSVTQEMVKPTHWISLPKFPKQ